MNGFWHVQLESVLGAIRSLTSSITNLSTRVLTIERKLPFMATSAQVQAVQAAFAQFQTTQAAFEAEVTNDVNTLEGTIATQGTSIASLQSQIAALQAQVAAGTSLSADDVASLADLGNKIAASNTDAATQTTALHAKVNPPTP